MKLKPNDIVIFEINNFNYTGVISKIIRKKFLFMNAILEVYSNGIIYKISSKNILFVLSNNSEVF